MSNQKPINEISGYESAESNGNERTTPEKTRVEGVIGHCVAERGFGFIHHEGGKDIFFHVDALGLETLKDKFDRQELEGTPVSFIEERGKKGPAAKRWSMYPLDLWKKIQEDIAQDKINRERWTQERDAYIKLVIDLIADTQLPENVRRSLHVETYDSVRHGAASILHDANQTKSTCLFIGRHAALLLRDESYDPYDLDYFHGYRPANMFIKTAELETVSDLLKQEVEIAPRREEFRDRILALYEGSVNRGRILPYGEILRGDWQISLISYKGEDGDGRYYPAGVGIDSCIALRYKGNIYQLEENDIKRLEEEIQHKFPSI